MHTILWGYILPRDTCTTWYACMPLGACIPYCGDTYCHGIHTDMGCMHAMGCMHTILWGYILPWDACHGMHACLSRWNRWDLTPRSTTRVNCSLLVTTRYSPLLATRHYALLVTTAHSPQIAHLTPLTAHRSLYTAQPLTAHRSTSHHTPHTARPPTAHHTPLSAHRSPLITHRRSHTAHHSHAQRSKTCPQTKSSLRT